MKSENDGDFATATKGHLDQIVKARAPQVQRW
jgi:hypothetical protein